MQINPQIYNKPIEYINKNASDVKLKEQTDSFEALILKYMLDSALKFDDHLYPKEVGSEIYQSMYKDSIAQSLSGSFGYSELLFNYLKDIQKEV
ncbi:Rod binding protein [Helicobacter sp. MIT 14-3879]|uniref:Rod binding protein n=1 Tax=Helicobacter sp. MIT 14-3879 TaxID=2040649 RepID=UPI000E1EB50F|nr:Rod binding protein [Helicobacter sp. MIT 14-3879]RDU64813.1 Rod binding protein [Helicobacter sp. MIT 14-3879]